MQISSPSPQFIFEIRPYRPADFDRLWEIDQSCFPQGIAYSQMELSAFISQRNALTLVAVLPEPVERVVGFVVAHSVRRKYGRVLTLDILPEARRFKLATLLMRDCEERIRAQGCSDMYLETAINNTAALRLYHKLGYEIVRTLPEYYASHALDAFQMHKRL